MSPTDEPLEREHPHAPWLIGRERELALLRDYLAEARTGRGHLVLIGGDAGIGKTTLVRALGQIAAGQGELILIGHCYDLSVTPPYGPWIEIADDYRPDEGHLPPPPTAFRDQEALQSLRHQAALFSEVRRFVSSVARRRPLLLVLEDLHWADHASLDLLRFLARYVAHLAVLLVATYRSDDLDRGHPLYHLLPLLARETPAQRLNLRPLAAAAVRRLVSAQYPLPSSDERRLVDYLQHHAEGNPFYVGELLRTLEESAILRANDDGWILGRLDHVVVPPLVRQVIDRRLTRLGEETRELLGVAAVIGQVVPLELWRQVSSAAEEQVLAAAEQAVQAHLLGEVPGGTAVQFSHALVREALYEGIGLSRRRVWHRRTAESLEQASPPDPDSVAHHYQQAGDARAVEWLVRAGDRAQESYAWRTAAERFESVLAILGGDEVSVARRGWLHYRIGRMLRFSDPVHGITHLHEAERTAIDSDDVVLAAYTVADRGLLRCFVGDLQQGLTEMEAGVVALDHLMGDQAARMEEVAAWVADTVPAERNPRRGSHDQSLGLALNSRRGTLAAWLAIVGRFSEALAIGEPYVAEASAGVPVDDVVLSSVGDAYDGLGLVYAAMGRPDDARQAFQSAREIFRAIDHHAIVVTAALIELTVVVVPYATEHREQRQLLLAEASQAWEHVGGIVPSSARRAVACLELLLLEGQWTQLRELALTARAHVNTDLRELALSALGALARYQGDPDLAWAQVDEVFPQGLATTPGNCWFSPAVALQRLAAALALDAGQLPRARAWIEAHDRWMDWSGAVLGRAEGQLLWARYHRLSGDLVLARQHAEFALSHASQPRQPLALLAAQRFLGELDTQAGRYADAQRHLSASLSVAEVCAAVYERALTLLAIAELHVATDDVDAARVLLDEVRAICGPLAAQPVLARVEALAERIADRSRLRAGSGALPSPAALSRREVEVLRLLASGKSNREIAEALAISLRTAERHIANLYIKIDASSRAEAIAYAHRHDLI